MTRKEKARLTAQVCCALMMTTPLLGSTAFAATITESKTYAEDAAVTDDVEISGGAITVKKDQGNIAVSLDGNTIISNTGYVLLAQGKEGEPSTNDEQPPGSNSIAGLRVNWNKNKTVQLTGNLQAGKYGTLEVDLSDMDSYLAGGLVVTGDTGYISLDLSHDATWYAAGDAYDLSKTKVTADGGTLDLWHATPTTRRTQTAGTRDFAVSNAGGSLNGAAFVLSSDIQNNKADHITLTGVTGTNVYKIKIAEDAVLNTDGVHTVTGDGLTVLTTDGTADTVTGAAYTTDKDVLAGLQSRTLTITPLLVTTNGITKLTKLTVCGNTLDQKESQTVTDSDGIQLVLPEGNQNISQTYDGDLNVFAAADGTSLKVTGGATAEDDSAALNINPQKNHTVKLGGDIQAAGNAAIVANLSNADSYLAGALKQDGLGSIQLDLSNGAVWYAAGDSYALSDALKLTANGGVIDLWHKSSLAYRTTAQGTRNFVVSNAGGSLNGAAFVLSSDIQNNKADNITLTGVTGTNAYKVQIANDPAMATDGTYMAANGGVTVLTTDDTADTVTGAAYTTDKDVAAGLQTKTLTLTPTLATTGGVTKLTKLTVSGNGNGGTGGSGDDGETAAVKEGKAMIMAKVSSTAVQGTVAAWRSADNDLHRRMGDLRADAGQAGAWGRFYGGKTDVKTAQASQVSYRGVQAGVDRSLTLGMGRLFTGVALSFMDGDISGSGVSGDTDSKLIGLYGSYMGNRGHFLDAIVKYGRQSNTTTTYSGANTYKGDTASNGLNMSVEYGWRGALKSGGYIEPQVEFNYSHVGSDDYTMTQNGAAGARTHNDAVNSCVGRLGVNIGQDTKQGNVYLKLSWLHEFAGDTGVTSSYGGYSKRSTESFKDSWFEYGIGFSQQLAKNQNLYGEITRTAGADKLSESWKADLGFRLSF